MFTASLKSFVESDVDNKPKIMELLYKALKRRIHEMNGQSGIAVPEFIIHSCIFIQNSKFYMSVNIIANHIGYVIGFLKNVTKRHGKES